MFDLPKSVTICGKEHPIRYDFRSILDILCAVNDPELTDEEKTVVSLSIFYPDIERIEDLEEAVKQLLLFINGGEEDVSRSNDPQLVDWEKDAPRIIPAVNKVLGYETRAVEYDRENNTGGVHWYTFLGAYMEIGDCLFAQVVRIRNKIMRHKKFEKDEREWYRKNRNLVDIKTRLTSDEERFLESLGLKNPLRKGAGKD